MTKALCSILLASRASALLAQGPSECGTNVTQLVVGSDFNGSLGYLPFEQANSAGTDVVGFDADVACEIAHRLGFGSVAFKQVPFQDLLDDLTASPSEFDIVLSAMSITQPQKDHPNVAFVKYNEDSLGIVLRVTDVTPELSDPATVLDALNDDAASLGVLNESREHAIKGSYPNTDAIESFSLDNLKNQLLVSGSAMDAIFVDGPTAVALAATDSRLFAVDNVQAILNEDTTSQGLGIAVNSQCCQLYANIQQAINDMNADGTLARLRIKHNVQQGFEPVSGLAPAGCTNASTIDSNKIANYLFSKYCRCSTPIIE
jgi:ABC-type amino acid transport substrate-binding protein